MPGDYQDRPGGVLFPNTRRTSPNAPGFTGNLVLDEPTFNALAALYQAGQPLKMDLAAWTKQGARGEFLSIRAQPVRDQQGQGQGRPFAAAANPSQQRPRSSPQLKPDSGNYRSPVGDYDDSEIPF